MNLICGDGSELPFPDDTFDLVSEATMFVQITDDTLSQKIADEMLRVTKRGGYILLADWRYSKPGDDTYLGLSKARTSKLFHLESQSRILGVHKGALIPPVGRFLSKYMPFAYFSVSFFCPFLVGQVAFLLQKAD